MAETLYYGETLWPGQWGHLAVIASFIFALLAAFAYTKSERAQGDPGWRSLGRLAFHAHGLSTFAVIGLLFYIMLNKFYEYEYVWAHVSDDLPYRYLFSAFWEDQAGSFLLWAFWHIVLGWILIATAGKWEAPVLVGLALIQAFILSMILGVYPIPGVDAYKIGVNPFALLRDTMDAPIFANADYLKLISGKGLNPLLQNYWMTIHPPTLFLGFASTAVPFCYAMAAMWRKDPTGWLKPVLPWALFSGSILGLGILMGAAWAYEALSFGGYWAWDPVENMSLVPWLILVAGIHTNLVSRQNGHSVRSTLVFYGLTFLLVLFSTFLTRSGVLEDSSVHAFTELGLEWQLVFYILFFLAWFVWQYVRFHRRVAVRKDEEALLSKEFWMFMGSLVLLFSALLITFTTSIPVYNKIADGIGWILGRDMGHLHRSMPLDPIEHYNKYQFWIAVFIGFLSGFAQFLRYNDAPLPEKRLKLLIRFAALGLSAAALTWLTRYLLGIGGWAYHILVFSAWFTVAANSDYLIAFLRGNLRTGASTLAHIGFGLMIIGIVASGLKKQHISQNRFAMTGILSQEMVAKNVLLFKEAPLLINGYRVTYLRDTIEGTIRTYDVLYEKLDQDGRVVETFQLSPNVQFDREFKKQAASNPSTKRYFRRDIFTHIAGLPPEQADVERAKAKEDSLRYLSYLLYPGRETALERTGVTLLSVSLSADHPDYEPQQGDLAITATLAFRDLNEDTSYIIRPMMVLRDGELIYNYPAKLDPVEVKVRLSDQVFRGVLYLEDDDLQWQTVTLKDGQSAEAFGYTLQLAGFNRDVSHPQYAPKDGDIGVAAIIEVKDPAHPDYREIQEPVFLVRDNQPFNIRSFSPGSGLHLRFVKVDPNDGMITLMAGRDPAYRGLPLEVAENYIREDYIVLEAIIFPGINFFWLGSMLMMVGLGLGVWNRRRGMSL